MPKFIKLRGIDSFMEDPSAANDIYLKPEIICHLETYSGMWPIQAFGPDGRVVMTGRHKQIINGTSIIFYNGQARHVLDDLKSVMDILDQPFD